MKTVTVTMLTLVTALLAGCSGTARLVPANVTAGRVVLSGAFMPAMAEARALMVEHCQGRFDLIEQRDAVTFSCRKQTQATAIELARASTRLEASAR